MTSRERLLKVLNGDNRFIFSTSDSIVPGTPKENIEAMVQTALECAG
jgi:uroporphyrinogen-III decarboxylase